MISVDLFDFQQDTVSKLLALTSNYMSKQTIVVKSPTGSGKTIMLIDYVDEYLSMNEKTAFVWLCPGAGKLEEQSREKMVKFAPSRQSQTLDDALTGGFDSGSTTFINWEKITKKDNNALKDGEKKNLFDKIDKAKRDGVNFIIIIDEEHNNKTAKAQEIIDAFDASHIIRVSATTTNNPNAELIEIDENDVIASGLITKAIYINENIEDDPDTDEGSDILLHQADTRRKAIIEEYKKLGKVIRPLVIVQFPSGKPESIEEVVQQLEEMGYTHENGLVDTWMTGEHPNDEKDLVANDGQVAFLLIKQAIATGWDCPRAKILVKLREGMSEQFTIQTIGRIRRMPERKHYENDMLDCCYVYTFDKEYKEGLLANIEKSYEKRHLYLKEKCKVFTITRENRDLDYAGLGEREIMERMYNYFVTTYNLTTDKELNKKKMADGDVYIFGNHIYGKWLKGRFETLSSITAADMQQTSTLVDTHRHGINMLHSTNELKTILSLQQYHVRAILERLFSDEGKRSKFNLISQTKEELYAFVINNEQQLKMDCRAISAEIGATQARLQLSIREDDFKMPEDDYLNYDPGVKNEIEFLSNAYKKYTSGFCTPKIRWRTERMFEKWCEHRDDIDWVYKNGDTGQQYLSLVYLTGIGKQRLFYPDYIVKRKDGEVWLIEAKGGESPDGTTQNIDKYAPFKFEKLNEYAKKHNLHWGFVRNYEDELYINNTEWHEEMTDSHWVPLDESF